MTNTERDETEITNTGIVRQRNEDGYIIHPDRHDTGRSDRRQGWALIISGFLFGCMALPAYGLGAAPLLMMGVYGVILVRRSRKKRRRIGGFYSNRRHTRDNSSENANSSKQKKG